MLCFVVVCKVNSGYGFDQWETTLKCNVVSHWLSPYPERSLILCEIAYRSVPSNYELTCEINVHAAVLWICPINECLFCMINRYVFTSCTLCLAPRGSVTCPYICRLSFGLHGITRSIFSKKYSPHTPSNSHVRFYVRMVCVLSQLL